ncbi:hypothetical protein VTH82DRAFT_2415 [Thermothelomyces myriococcoides]
MKIQLVTAAAAIFAATAAALPAPLPNNQAIDVRTDDVADEAQGLDIPDSHAPFDLGGDDDVDAVEARDLDALNSRAPFDLGGDDDVVAVEARGLDIPDSYAPFDSRRR